MISEIVIGVAIAVVTAGSSYIFGRRRSESDILKNSADIEKSNAESAKISTENKLAQVELFDKLNDTLTEQNERLLKSNSVLIDQNRKLLKYIKSLEDRIAKLEEEVKNERALGRNSCANAETCENRING